MPRVGPALAFALLIGLALTAPALADDDPQFRRTTPRGSFGRDGPALSVGVPGGRAWGIESELRAVPDERSSFRATIEVSDPAVREAFVRIAWYDRFAARPRQFSLTDARLVRAGESATFEITLDPPERAVAYRIRVLARLGSPHALSRPDAVRAVLGDLRASPRYPQTRLLR
jgi:hypothetical protein